MYIQGIIVLAITVILATLLIAATLIFISLKVLEYLKNKDAIMLASKFVIDDSYLATMDYMITESFEMYKLFNDIDDTYINQETMENIIRDVAKDVVSKISGTLYNKMKLIYNGDEINNIIVKKVQLLVTDYSTNINSIVESNIKTNIDLSSAFEE